MSIQTRSTRGWIKASTKGDVVVWGLGKKSNWGRMKGDITHWQPAADGSCIMAVADGTCLTVDFSGASGTEGMLVMTGPGAPRDNVITVGGMDFSFKFLTTSEEPTPGVEGDRILVGAQTVSMDEGRIVLARMADLPARLKELAD